MLTARRRYKNQTMRRTRTAQSVGAKNDVMIPSNVTIVAVHSASTMAITFNVPVVYSGILPNYTNNGKTVTGVTMTDPLHATLTFNGATAAGATVVPFQDAAFRTMSGGFVLAGTYTAT